MGASWQVLKKDKEMLVFPLISGICCLLIFASFVYPLYTGGYLQDADGSWSFPPRFQGEDIASDRNVNNYILLFLYYFCNYFVIVFFNSAIVACAKIRMDGGDPTVSDGLKASTARITSIFGWALVSASVGLILRIIEDRSEKVGSIVAGLLGLAWTVVSFLVIPVLVIENKGPIEALKESTRLLKKTWGQQLIGNFSFGLVFFVLAIPAIIIVLLAAFAGGMGTILYFCIGLAVMYMILLSLVQSTLQAIFQTALYLYVQNRTAPPGFDSRMLGDSMSSGGRKSRFGLF